MTLAFILLLVLAFLLVIFTLQNTQVVDVNLLFWGIDQAPLALIIFSCLILGIIIGASIYIPKTWKKNTQIKNLNKEIANANELLSKYNLQAKQAKNNQHTEGVRLEDNGKKTIFDEDE